MAKLTLEQSSQTIIKSLQRCKDMNMSEEVFLSVFRDRLLDEDLVDKMRRNEVHMAVNKHFGTNYTFKQVRAADPRLVETVDIRDADLDVSSLDNKPAVTPELNNTNAEDNTMVYAPNFDNNTTSATASVTSQAAAENAAPEVKVDLTLEAPQLAMAEGSSIKNSWLAAGGAVVGGAVALLKSDNNLGGYVGAVAGVAAAYFGTEHFFNEMEPTLLNRGVLIGGGVAVGAALTVGGNAAVSRFVPQTEEGDIVLNVPGLVSNTPVADTAGLF